jgi:GNAT superfamily N-acetyltransferase
VNKSLQISKTDIDHIDIEQYCILQQKSFAEVFAYSQIDNSYLDPAFFKWKYNTPNGKARIAVAEENNEMLASVAMYPVVFIKDQEVFNGWHFVEAATLPEARGRGLFKACMQKLMDSLKNDEVIYVFPNKTSMRGTEKIGFQQLDHIPFYGKIVFRKSRNNQTEFFPGCHFSAKQDSYAKALAIKNKIMIFRDAAYMNWRYNSHPHASYYSYSAMQDDRVVGNIVIRPVKYKQQKLLLLMEFHSLNKEAEKEMLIFLRKVASIENCSFAGLFSNNEPQPGVFASGLIKLPSFMLPKKQILMTYKKNSETLQNDNWFIQTGDWDAF